MQDLSDLFKALSDETRLRMLALILRRGELCVCDLVEALKVTQTKASRHLRYLLHAGLLLFRRENIWVYYRVPERPQPEAAVVLDAVRPVLARRDLAVEEQRLDAWNHVKRQNRGCGGIHS